MWNLKVIRWVELLTLHSHQFSASSRPALSRTRTHRSSYFYLCEDFHSEKVFPGHSHTRLVLLCLNSQMGETGWRLTSSAPFLCVVID